jgi:hypothetical protein
VNDRLDVLDEALIALQQAAQRLHTTQESLRELFPLTAEKFETLAEISRERLDAFAIRYARCQDLLYPTMRALGHAQLEPKADKSFLDLFALMQKENIVGDIDDWERQRSLRNAVSHEYPHAQEIVDILNAIAEATPEILAYVGALELRIKRLKEGSE